jgi:hypothetical protein
MHINSRTPQQSAPLLFPTLPEVYDSPGGYYVMTEEEIRRQKVDLRIQIEDAEKRLAGLREKAIARAEKVIEFGERLKTAPEINIYREGHSVIHGQNIGKLRMLSDADIRVLELTPALEIANSIRKEIANIAILQQRLSNLR